MGTIPKRSMRPASERVKGPRVRSRGNWGSAEGADRLVEFLDEGGALAGRHGARFHLEVEAVARGIDPRGVTPACLSAGWSCAHLPPGC